MKILLRTLLLSIPLCVACVPLAAQMVLSPQLNLLDSTQQHVLYTQRGDRLLGQVVQIVSTDVYFRLRSGQEAVFPFATVAFVGVSGESWNPRRAQMQQGGNGAIPSPFFSENLPYSATAFPFESRGQYRNTMVLLNTVDFQLGRHLNLGAGVLIPVVVNLRAKFTVAATPFLRLGIADNAYLVPIFDGGAVNHLYGILTLGDRDRYLSLGYGALFDYSFGDTERLPTISMGGHYAFNPRNRLFVEVGYVYDQSINERLFFPSLHYSFTLRRSRFDGGLVGIPDSFIPLLPMLSYHLAF